MNTHRHTHKHTGLLDRTLTLHTDVAHLIADDHNIRVACRVAVGLPHPRFQGFKGARTGDIIHNKNGVTSAVELVPDVEVLRTSGQIPQVDSYCKSNRFFTICFSFASSAVPD